MDMILTRKLNLSDGIFGELKSADGFFLCATLEHAYPDGANFCAKLPSGTYVCQRGLHRLSGMANSFETFEITNVIGHTNILIHVGNYNNDSSGCVLVGEKIVGMPNGMNMITNSKEVFGDFMDFQDGFDIFSLSVIG